MWSARVPAAHHRRTVRQGAPSPEYSTGSRPPNRGREAPRAGEAGKGLRYTSRALERILETVRLHRWDELSLEKVTEMVSRKIVAGERQTMAQVYLKRGAVVPIHAHESEQLTYVLQGALRFLVNGEEVVVQEGEVLHIPSNLPHQAEALDDTFELDVFSPPRVVG